MVTPIEKCQIIIRLLCNKIKISIDYNFDFIAQKPNYNLTHFSRLFPVLNGLLHKIKADLIAL